jgi:hypothetical protein
VICPACQQLARFQRWQSKNFLSVLGEIRLQRAYYYCRHCGHGHHPWEGMLGLTGQDLTPAASELTSLAGLLSSFEESSRKILPKLAGLRLSESTAERTTEAAGQRLKEHWAAGETLGGFQPWPWSADNTGQSCAYVSVDATGVGQQGPKGAKADGRMAYVGMVFNVREEKPSQARYLAGLYTLEELGSQLRRQAGQVGMNQAQQWIALTDGGAGLEEFMQCYFPQAVCILDFFHAAEHLHELAKLWHGGDEEQGKALGHEWSHCLKHEGGQALLAVLEDLDLRGRSATVREKYRQVTGYVRNNVRRMDYPRYRAKGWLIGSGHIEAACKTVVGQRLKGTGMRWSEAGADAVCCLRALFKSERDQWEAFWQTRGAA